MTNVVSQLSYIQGIQGASPRDPACLFAVGSPSISGQDASMPSTTHCIPDIAMASMGQAPGSPQMFDIYIYIYISNVYMYI